MEHKQAVAGADSDWSGAGLKGIRISADKIRNNRLQSSVWV